MQQKSTRGVQQEEVSAAADALLAERLRPTIERVRMKIGRGSPNTVAPMLEAWFAILGARLGVVPSKGEGGPPDTVRKAMDGVWAAALAAAREQAIVVVAAERDALAQNQAALAAERAELARQQAVIAERMSALEERLSAANRQVEEHAERTCTLEAELTGCKGELTAARAIVADLVLERDGDRRRFDEQLAAQAEDRRRIEERGQATERRLLAEIDRARQEARQHRSALEQSQRQHQDAYQALHESREVLAQAHNEAQVQLASFKERLVSSEQREGELRRQIEEQKAATAAAIARLVPELSRSASRRTTGTARAKMPRRKAATAQKQEI